MTQKTIFELLHFVFGGKIERISYDGVFVSYDGKNAIIGAKEESAFARGCFLLVSEIKKGKTSFEIHQKAAFQTCGIMLDVSRNGVMRVSAVKKFITYMAALGLNMLMLYTEDTYTLKDYSYFGYLRGRYTEAELCEIDAYAAALGIEVIPCIQTLGHMAQYLKYDTINKDIRDTESVLLIGSEATYSFIEECIKVMRRCFRSNRIHIGMDEAHDVGLGKYLDINGYHNRFEIFKAHLDTTIALCEKYHYTPMVWSDMFYNFASASHTYRDTDTCVPKDMVPAGAQLVYWDYYSTDYEYFDRMLANHKSVCADTVFAGGLWTWNGFIPRSEMAFANTIPALQAAMKNGICTVFATMWADNGCETNHFLALPLLTLYSELNYRGADCPMRDIYDTAQALCNVDLAFMLQLSKAHGMPTDRPHRTFLNALLYGDVFYALPELDENDADYLPNIGAALETAERMYAENDENRDMYLYYIRVLEILKDKAALRFQLRNKYIENDRQYLRNVAETVLPRIEDTLKKLYRLFEKQWTAVYKPFGYEVMVARFGSTAYRTAYAAEVINAYLTGKRETIEMLEEEVLPYKDAALIRFYKNSVTTSEIM